MEVTDRKVFILPQLDISNERLIPTDRFSEFSKYGVLIALPLTLKWDGYMLGQWWLVGYSARDHFPRRLDSNQRKALLANSFRINELLADNWFNWPIFEERRIHIHKPIGFNETNPVESF